MKENKNILMLVRTSGLEYDDRIRKECLSLIKLGYSIEILANYTNNEASKSITSYGVPFKVFRLFTRAMLPSSKFLLIKMFEFWIRTFIKKGFKKYDFVWIHEEYMALNILIKPVRGKYIFDLHELPSFLSANEKRKRIYKKIENKCFKLIVANIDRLDFMDSQGLVGDRSKYNVLYNFPDKIFNQQPKKDLSKEILKQLNSVPYILMQGGGHKDRYPLEALKAIKKTTKFKAVLIGPVEEDYKDEIQEKYGNMVILTGYINQMDIISYIDHAVASLVMYSHVSPNNIYCEPNRFYQALMRGVPVVVGNNPPMKRIITTSNVGVVLSSDGSDFEDITKGIELLDKNYAIYKENSRSIKDRYVWESQMEEIKRIVNT